MKLTFARNSWSVFLDRVGISFEQRIDDRWSYGGGSLLHSLRALDLGSVELETASDLCNEIREYVQREHKSEWEADGDGAHDSINRSN